MNYFDESGTTIRSELLDSEAEKTAKSFVKIDDRGRIDNRPKYTLSSAQLRRFFGEFRQLEKKVTAQGFERVKPLVKMTKSKAAYAANPRNQKIPSRFRDFLTRHIDGIDSEKDFRAFMLHFEAVVGFFYGLGLK